MPWDRTSVIMRRPPKKKSKREPLGKKKNPSRKDRGREIELHFRIMLAISQIGRSKTRVGVSEVCRTNARKVSLGGGVQSSFRIEPRPRFLVNSELLLLSNRSR